MTVDGHYLPAKVINIFQVYNYILTWLNFIDRNNIRYLHST
jgi:hypothetical protein